MAFLDRAQQVGMRVLFDFSEGAMKCPDDVRPCTSPPQIGVIRDAVTRLRDHPAVLSWYLIDEPDGKHYPPAWVAEAAAAIRAIDPSRPISACFESGTQPFICSKPTITTTVTTAPPHLRSLPPPTHHRHHSSTTAATTT